MRFMTRSQCGLLLVSLVATLFLAACGGSNAATTGTATATSATGATDTPTAAAASTVTASTSLCDLMSKSAVSSVVGGTIGSVNRNKTTAADGSTSVNCTYLPASGGTPVDAEISYLFTSNGQAAYSANKADDSSRGETETDISGLGDAAFWAVSAAHKNVLQVSVLKGNVLLIMTLGGAGADGSTMLNGAEGLARQALPSI
jgi:hypothetical protein